jgi:hypothetical protein
MSTPTAKFQITVPQKDEYGVLLSEKTYYVMLVADGANCAANEIVVEPVTGATEFSEEDTLVLPNSGVMPPQDPPKLVTLIEN